MTIVVTGATGGLGGAVVEALLDVVPAGGVAAVARDPARLDQLARRGVDIRRGDDHDPDAPAAAFAAPGDVERLLGRPPTSVSTVLRHLRAEQPRSVERGRPGAA